MKKAFTMAEVLITLGIIGIVAAMTLPSLINNAQDRHFKTMFKKQYSIISQALLKVYYDNGDEIQFNEWREMLIYVCQIGHQLKAAKSGIECDEVLKGYEPGKSYTRSDLKYQWHANKKWFDKTGKGLSLNTGYSAMTFYLPDGAWINFNCYRQVFVDVNGAKNPNKVGRDIFYFTVPKKSATPTFWAHQTGTRKYTIVNSCSGSSNATYVYDDTYIDNCNNGSGWGCSPLYILQ